MFLPDIVGRDGDDVYIVAMDGAIDQRAIDDEQAIGPDERFVLVRRGQIHRYYHVGIAHRGEPIGSSLITTVQWAVPPRISGP